MKKRVIAVLTAVLMTASLAGCGSGKLSNDYVTVNKYKGLEVTEVAKNKVSDDSVEQEMQSRLEAAATEQDVTDRAAQSGDWVNIDYTGTLDGVAFDGGTATGYDLELGSGSFIGASGDYQGFEDQIVGHNTGEEFDITVQFPENYQSSDLAGKPANFHIVLNKIYQKVTPELTDEWVANNSESSKTVDEYKEEVKNSLQEQQDDSGNSQLKQEVQTALLDQIDSCQTPMIVDADALNLLGEHRSYIGRLPKGSILTPHPKELERLVGKCQNSYERLTKARELAKSAGVYIILKGAYSVIIAPSGKCWFNPTGNPGMATGGSGDVLTGVVLALLAQGYDAETAARMAAYVHGLAGDIACKKHGAMGMTAGDIVTCLPLAWRMLEEKL